MLLLPKIHVNNYNLVVSDFCWLLPDVEVNDTPRPVKILSFAETDKRRFSVACFWCQNFGDVSPSVCAYHFSSVLGAAWQPFGK